MNKKACFSSANKCFQTEAKDNKITLVQIIEQEDGYIFLNENDMEVTDNSVHFKNNILQNMSESSELHVNSCHGGFGYLYVLKKGDLNNAKKIKPVLVSPSGCDVKAYE